MADFIFWAIVFAMLVCAISTIHSVIKSIINNTKWREAFRCGECRKIHSIPLNGVCSKCGTFLVSRQHNGKTRPSENAERVVVRRRFFKWEVKTCPHGFQVVGNCPDCYDEA